MIKHVLITGDIHGQFKSRLTKVKELMPDYIPEEIAIIILGDVGLNYYLSKHDWKNKHIVSNFGYTVYCLRGNHEQRPSLVGKKMKFVYDEFVHGYVWIEEEFPQIKYFDDKVAEYEIMDKKILTIPGAYSVDKWYRLQNGWPWFAQEQLSVEEMQYAEKLVAGKYYDFVFSHTCPIIWEPTDLFLSMIDQSTVDKTMEVWMSKIEETFLWKHWLFAHYHTDRIERPYVEIFYQKVESLDAVASRWKKYDETGEVDWRIPKSPAYYMT